MYCIWLMVDCFAELIIEMISTWSTRWKDSKTEVLKQFNTIQSLASSFTLSILSANHRNYCKSLSDIKNKRRSKTSQKSTNEKIQITFLLKRYLIFTSPTKNIDCFIYIITFFYSQNLQYNYITIITFDLSDNAQPQSISLCVAEAAAKHETL